MKSVRLTAAEQMRLGNGLPVTRLLDADESKEVAVVGAVWVDAPMEQYVESIRDIEHFEQGGGFHITKRISATPKIEDFDRLRLSDEDAADLRSCRPQNCELKLSENGMARIREAVDWTAPTARADLDAAVRALALDYVNGYLEGGNARLAVYRDSKRPTFVALEFVSMVDRLPSLSELLPDIRRYLLEFPKVELPNSESFLYWQEAQFGLKPTVRINHVIISERPNGVVIASKMLYASHYFWTAIELRVLQPDPSRGGFWFVSVNRSRSDGLSGFVGRIIRGRVRDEVEHGMTAALQATKALLEGQGR